MVGVEGVGVGGSASDDGVAAVLVFAAAAADFFVGR